ncbi:MAG: PIN domain-containing protein [Rhizobiales bacterium]|nr:PIN domain-containing protein [Hyphomicrobiales bacterium]
MIAVDTNILVYAHRMDSPFHAPAARRITELAEGGRAWAIPWPCVHELLSIVTNPRIYDPPTAIAVALDYVEGVFQSPNLVLLAETDLHWKTLRPLVAAGRIAGARAHDARIAAICIQHRVRELWSADRDFSRFPDLTAVNPLMS